jgi:hypothetical protein
VLGAEERLAQHAIDGDMRTSWHTNFLWAPAPLPHHLDVFFAGEQRIVFGIQVWPRPDQANGRIGKFEIYLSDDGSTFNSDPAAVGEWADSDAAKVSLAKSNRCTAAADHGHMQLLTLDTNIVICAHSDRNTAASYVSHS